AVAGEPGDLLLLWRELASRLGTALAYLLTRRQQLAAGALGERLHPDRGEHVMGRTQLLARVGASALATQPLPVEQVRACKLRVQLGSAETINRLAVEVAGDLPVAQQRPAASLD